ncbi:hypothetical protein [Sphaerothrix gracilis]|uniref:hypothetical protein n=1 Tax=Sphaerothrix gracilis TaxID=3151835 RepID=UPI0031FCF012
MQRQRQLTAATIVTGSSVLALSLSLCLIPVSKKLGALATLVTGSYTAGTVTLSLSVRGRLRKLSAEQEQLSTTANERVASAERDRDEAAKQTVLAEKGKENLRGQLYQLEQELIELQTRLVEQQGHSQQLQEHSSELLAALTKSQEFVAQYEQLCPEYLERATAAEMKAEMFEVALHRSRLESASPLESDLADDALLEATSF